MIVQVALAVTLMVGGGLLMHSFVRMVALDKGFEPEGVLTFNVRMPPSRSSVAEIMRVANDLVARLRAEPRVRAAGYTVALPTVSLRMNTGFRLSLGEAPPPLAAGAANTVQNPSLLFVSEAYPRALAMRLVAGHHLDEHGRVSPTRGLLINETLARGRFPGEDPVGRHVYLGGRDEVPWEIAGVVQDVWQRGLAEPPGPQVFVGFPPVSDPVMQVAGTRLYHAVRTEEWPLAVLPIVREVLAGIDPGALLDNVAPLDEVLASSIARPRMYAILLGAFAGAALMLAAIGIYGVMAYAVAQNRREIGLRMALGAPRRAVLAQVVGRAGALAGIGLAAGLAAAVGLSRYLTGMIFGLTPLDAPTYAAVAAVFATVAMCASYLPARRATQVDPLAALRSE